MHGYINRWRMPEDPRGEELAPGLPSHTERRRLDADGNVVRALPRLREVERPWRFQVGRYV